MRSVIMKMAILYYRLSFSLY